MFILWNGYVFGTKDFGLNNNTALGLPDPGTMKPWKHVGEWNFKESDAGALLGGASDGIIQNIPDKIALPNGNIVASNPRVVGLKGRVFFPADKNGVSDPASISGKRNDYPLVVIVPWKRTQIHRV